MKRSRVLAPLLAGALIAAACGGSDGESSEPTAEPIDSVETAEPDAEPADTTAPDDGDEPAETTAPDEAPAETGAPVRGGTISYLLEAESDTWDIPGANCAVSCITVMRAVADPLLIVNEVGEVEPFLAESFSVNDDFTEWTITMREGVVFHDGTPADGAAVHRNMIEMANGILQGQVFWDLANGTPIADGPDCGCDVADSILLNDDGSVTVLFDEPTATFGFALAERTGWLIAPSYWDNPDRAGALMVATGPFMMVDQVRGEVTRLEANPDYWRTGADGEPLPYLDGIEFRPNPDVDARRATMQAGDADINMDSFGENRPVWEEDWIDDGNGLAPKSGNKETTYLLINNSVPPFDNPEFRRAVAHCTDRDEYLAFRSPENALADGPFAEGSLGYLEDPGFPQFDPDEGNRILDEIGRLPIEYGTTNVPANLITAELFQEQWSQNCGLDVTINQFEQGEFIGIAIGGAFQVFLWRNHGQGNPALERIWWDSRHAAGLALNFGRIINSEVDELLKQMSATVDNAELDELGKQINQSFAANVNNIWLNTTEWNNPHTARLQNVGNLALESGNNAQAELAGRIWINEVWIEE